MSVATRARKHRQTHRQWSAHWLLCLCCAAALGCENEPIAHSQESQQAIIDSEGSTIDFDAAIREVNFHANADDNGAAGGNGIPDSIEMALIARILNDPESDLETRGGVSRNEVLAAWKQAQQSATTDIAPHLEKWPNLATLVAGYVLVGSPDSFQAIDRLCTSFGTPLQGNYELASRLNERLSPDGDADGDGYSNLQEYQVFGQEDRESYIMAALNPSQIPSAEQLTAPTAAIPRKKIVGILLFPGFELLDAFGPAEIWGNVPDLQLLTISEQAGPIMSAQGIAADARYTFQDTPPIDILLVPGGMGTTAQLKNERLLQFLRKCHQTTALTTSVCTGSALLARAGILDGKRATSNKAYFSLATAQSDRVLWIEEARWVEDGKVVTSSGVSAGIDMALAVVAKSHGTEHARHLADSLEYIWHEDAHKDPFSHRLNRAAISAP